MDICGLKVLSWDRMMEKYLSKQFIKEFAVIIRRCLLLIRD
jgi:hypothetical protein